MTDNQMWQDQKLDGSPYYIITQRSVNIGEPKSFYKKTPQFLIIHAKFWINKSNSSLSLKQKNDIFFQYQEFKKKNLLVLDVTAEM